MIYNTDKGLYLKPFVELLKMTLQDNVSVYFITNLSLFGLSFFTKMHSLPSHSNGDETDDSQLSSAVNIYSTRENLYTTENNIYNKE